MNTITEPQLLALADLFGEPKTATMFKGYPIVVEKIGYTYDYEIFTQDPVLLKWHVWKTEEDFASEEEAIAAAKKYIDNWEPSDDYYAQ